MPTAAIKINGTLGSHLQATLGDTVTLSNNNDTDVTTWAWTIVDQPAGSTDTLYPDGSHNGAALTLSQEGSYLIKLMLNNDPSLVSYAVAAVNQLASGLRVPALHEPAAVGWGTEVQKWLKRIDLKPAEPATADIYDLTFTPNEGAAYIQVDVDGSARTHVAIYDTDFDAFIATSLIGQERVGYAVKTGTGKVRIAAKTAGAFQPNVDGSQPGILVASPQVLGQPAVHENYIYNMDIDATSRVVTKTLTGPVNTGDALTLTFGMDSWHVILNGSEGTLAGVATKVKNAYNNGNWHIEAVGATLTFTSSQPGPNPETVSLVWDTDPGLDNGVLDVSDVDGVINTTHLEITIDGVTVAQDVTSMTDFMTWMTAITTQPRTSAPNVTLDGASFSAVTLMIRANTGGVHQTNIDGTQPGILVENPVIVGGTASFTLTTHTAGAAEVATTGTFVIDSYTPGKDAVVYPTDNTTIHLDLDGKLGVVSGGIGATELASGAVETNKIANGAVDGTKIATGAVSGAAIPSEGIVAAHVDHNIFDATKGIEGGGGATVHVKLDETKMGFTLDGKVTVTADPWSVGDGLALTSGTLAAKVVTPGHLTVGPDGLDVDISLLGALVDKSPPAMLSWWFDHTDQPQNGDTICFIYDHPGASSGVVATFVTGTPATPSSEFVFETQIGVTLADTIADLVPRLEAIGGIDVALQPTGVGGDDVVLVISPATIADYAGTFGLREYYAGGTGARIHCLQANQSPPQGGSRVVLNYGKKVSAAEEALGLCVCPLWPAIDGGDYSPGAPPQPGLTFHVQLVSSSWTVKPFNGQVVPSKRYLRIYQGTGGLPYTFAAGDSFNIIAIGPQAT